VVLYVDNVHIQETRGLVHHFTQRKRVKRRLFQTSAVSNVGCFKRRLFQTSAVSNVGCFSM